MRLKMHLWFSLARELNLGVRIREPEALHFLVSNDIGTDIHFFRVASGESFNHQNSPHPTTRSR